MTKKELANTLRVSVNSIQRAIDTLGLDVKREYGKWGNANGVLAISDEQAKQIEYAIAHNYHLFSEREEKRIIAFYESHTILETSRKYKISRSVLARILEAHGKEIRSIGRRPKLDMRAFLDLRPAHTIGELAEIFGCSRQALYQLPKRKHLFCAVD